MTHLLDVDQLRTFVAISDAGSFTRAAEMVHKTQSAVSMQMKRLEERLGKELFARDGRQSRLTEEGERLLDYARRIVRLNLEAIAAFNEAELAGHVRLGVPDDYADRYLPEVLARFSRSNPRVEVTVVCEPTHLLVEAIAMQQLDLAIVTQCETRIPSEIFREERLLWVTSARHSVHEEEVVPLALGRATCSWRRSATSALDGIGRRSRVLYSSWNSNAVGAAVMAGLAVSVLPESAIRAGMRVLSPAEGYPALPSCKIGLMRASANGDALVAALAGHVVQGLENLPSRRETPAREAAE
jgi:DNA-binding transcriptional LysR family regulator